MSAPRDRDTELEQLMAALESGAIDSEIQARMDALTRDDEALDRIVDQLEVQALLRWHHGASQSSATPATPPSATTSYRPSTRIRWLLAAAAALFVVGATLFNLPFSSEKSTDIDDPPARDTTRLASGWTIDPTEGAQFVVGDDSRRIALSRGEIRLRASAQADAMHVETPHGVVHGTGGDFYVGTHEVPAAVSLTRILVVAGVVTLANAVGEAEGRAGDLIVTDGEEAPVRVLAQSGADFGFDLYRELAKAEPNGNLFFSPFSITNVLAMALEGARGETAEEIGQVLHLPPAAKRLGSGAQRIPFELTRMRNAYAELNRRFNEHRSQGQVRLERDLVEARRALAALAAEVDAARRARDGSEARRLDRQFRERMAEYDVLAAQLKSYRLSVANALWADESYALSERYVNSIRVAFDTGAVVRADFRSDSSREAERINAWVRERTNDKIPALVDDRSINASTRLVLLNAIHFKGEWSTPFDPRYTSTRDFTGPDGTRSEARLMHNYAVENCRYGAFSANDRVFRAPDMVRSGQTEGLYPGRGGVQIVELPYRGSDLSMVVLLPTDETGIGELERKLSAERVSRWLEQLERREAKVVLPKFRSETSYEISNALKALGMRRAFRPQADGEGADFSGMVEDSAETGDFFVQAVLHRAFVNVDEKGTEAAAATSIAAGATAPLMVPFVPYFRADHAFVYLIRDIHTGTVLFLGRVAKP